MDFIHSASKIFLRSNAENSIQNGNSSSSYTFKIDPLIIANNDDSVFVLGLESASIPLSFYAVNQTNDTFSINGISYNIQDGNYSYGTLITQLNNLTTLVWAYNLDTNKLRITTAGTYLFNPTANSASDVLGYLEGTTYNANDELSNVLNLTYTTGVQIRLDNIQTTNKSADTNGGSSLLARLPITTPAYTILQFFNPQPFYTTIKNKILSEISISLVDDNNDLLILNGNPAWFITLRVDYQTPKILENRTTAIQDLRTEAIQPLLEQQEQDLQEIQNIPPVVENTNRIQRRDLAKEILEKRMAENPPIETKRPLRKQKKIRRK